MAVWLQAGSWGLLGGAALVLRVAVESVVLGVGLLGGGAVSLPVLAAVSVSNVPEGLSSAAGMKRGGRSAGYVFGVRGGIALASGLAAGAILTMIADTMIPEAFEEARTWTGLITSVGFLAAFAIHLA